MTEDNKLRLEYIPLSKANLWDNNPKKHDIGALVVSIWKYGFQDPPHYSPVISGLLYGNGRTTALIMGQREGRNPPAGVAVDPQTGEWLVPVIFGNDLPSREVAEAFAVDHNNLTMAGGEFTAYDMARMWDEERYAELLTRLANDADEHPVTVDGDALDALLGQMASEHLQGNEFTSTEQKDAVKNGGLDERANKVDLIYTAGTINHTALDAPRWCLVHCCIAVRSGWLYGVQSSGSGGICSNYDVIQKHKVEFIDNEFKGYKHDLHCQAVAKYKPKYATVRDIMTKDQCQEVGIEYYPFTQILDWAEELSQYAQNVIVIPKYDCLSKIPEKFMLGYSVPTSYGGTPLPIEMFKGRRIHLLGGSPNKQIAFWQAAPDSIVSLDNNYLLKIANYGNVWCPDGQTRSLTDLGFGFLNNPLYVALTISLGNFAAYFKKQGAVETQIEEYATTGEIE